MKRNTEENVVQKEVEEEKEKVIRMKNKHLNRKKQRRMVEEQVVDEGMQL